MLCWQCIITLPCLLRFQAGEKNKEDEQIESIGGNIGGNSVSNHGDSATPLSSRSVPGMCQPVSSRDKGRVNDTGGQWLFRRVRILLVSVCKRCYYS